MELHRVMKNDPEYVAGYSDAMDQIEYLLFHTESPVASIKRWIERQSEIVDSLNAARAGSDNG